MINNRKIMNKYNTFCHNLKYYRKLRSLTQEKLAEKCDISTSYIKQIESCREFKNISIIVILKLADALNIEIEDLFKS